MKAYKEKDKEYYKIKVNKKGSNNKIANSLIYLNNKHNINYNYNYKNQDINTPASNKSSKNNSNNIIIFTPYHNNYNSNIPPKKHINSDERDLKYYKNKYEQNNIDYYNDNNHLDFFNIKTQKKTILNSNNIDENLLNFRPNNDFINCGGNIRFYNGSINNEKMESDNRRKLFINTKYFNDFDFIDSNNYRTIGHNNINNYINELQLINNFYDYEKDLHNKLNNYNFQSYNKNCIFSSEKKKNKDFSYNTYNPLLNYSSKKNKNKAFVKTYCIRSKIFSKKNIQESKDNLLSEKDKNKNKKTSKINEINNFNFIKDNNIKNNYSNDGIKLKNNNINFQCNKYKYDYYNKDLFDKYRGKLIQEFDRHMQKVINNHLLDYKQFFVHSLQEIKNKCNLITSANRSILKKKKYQKCIKTNYSDKKYSIEKDLLPNQNYNIMSYNTIDSINKVNLNKNPQLRKNKISDKILNNNRLIFHIYMGIY